MNGFTALTDLLLAETRGVRPEHLRLASAAAVSAAAPAVPVEESSADAQLLSDAARARQVLGPLEHGPTDPAPAADPSLSAAGRAISRMLAALPRDPGPLAGASPLLPHAPTAGADELAHALSTTLASSGLFYESHLAALAEGRLDRAQIELEPQARWTPRDADRAEARAETRAAAGAAGVAGHAGAPAHEATPSFDADVRVLVTRQLELRDTGVFQWRGDAWPGVPMEWSVSEEAPRREPRTAGEPRPSWWTTSFRVDMPSLGAVDVRLRLCGAEVRADIAAQPDAAGLLRERGLELQSRLTRAGFAMTACAVSAGAAR